MKQYSVSTQIATLRNIEGPTIAQASDQQIKQELNCVYMIVGLRPAAFPSLPQELFIIQWIRENYGHKLLKELSTAFNMAIKGELDLQDIKHYDNFSVMYLSQILGSFDRRLKFLHSQVVPKPNAKQLPPPSMTIDNKREEVEEFIQNNKLGLAILPLYIYDYMDELGMIDQSDGAKSQRMERAKKIKMDMIYGEATEGGAYKRKEYAEFKKLIESGVIPEGAGNDLDRLAKRVAIMEVVKANKK